MILSYFSSTATLLVSMAVFVDESAVKAVALLGTSPDCVEATLSFLLLQAQEINERTIAIIITFLIIVSID